MKIGIDLGGSHIGIATIDENGKIVTKIEKDLEKQENMEQYILNYVDKTIEKLCKTANIAEIGIAAPGNPNGCKITNLVNLGIDEIDFSHIKEKYHIPLKSINDAKAAALAEKKYGTLKGTKDSVFLCLGTGIGGAVFLHDKLLEATKNPGFELGHMIIQRDGIQCKCGKKGCFETYCSIKRLKEKIQGELEKISKSKNEEIHILDAKELNQKLQEHIKDYKIQEMLDEYVDNLIIGLSNVIDIFEPEIICLGGSFVYFKEVIYNKLINEMQERKYVFNKNSLPKVKLAELKNDAGIIGATLITY